MEIYFFCVSKLSIDLFFKLPVNSYLTINIEGKIGQPTVIRTSSFIFCLPCDIQHFPLIFIQVPHSYLVYVQYYAALKNLQIHKNDDKISQNGTTYTFGKNRANIAIQQYSLCLQTKQFTVSSHDMCVLCVILLFSVAATHPIGLQSPASSLKNRLHY